VTGNAPPDRSTSLDGEFAVFARQLALDSADVINRSVGTPIDVELKGDLSPVTETDRRAEETMRARIRRRYPEHGVIGEEFGNEKEDAEFVWTLDPIDGTISFVSGCPLFGTLIGLLHRGKPVLGAIHQPLLGQLCIGNGRRTMLNGQVVRVRETTDLSRATLLTTDLKYVGAHQDRRGFERLVAGTGLFRTWGDCYGYLLVARGRADIMLDPIMSPWDLIPLIPIIRGSGGVITSWTGEDPLDASSCVAAGRSIHSRVIELLNS
jgi:histidinol phosphatase-like enzyme (inositol monophosphatase family)